MMKSEKKKVSNWSYTAKFKENHHKINKVAKTDDECGDYIRSREL